MYEKIRDSFKQESNKSVELLIPIKLEFSVSEIPLINEKKQVINQLGIKFEPFGGTTIIIREIPLWIPLDFLIKTFPLRQNPDFSSPDSSPVRPRVAVL